MKSLLLIVLSAILSLFPGKVSEEPTTHKQFEKEWKKVESYRDKGLPRSALDVVDKIYRQAKKENNTPQFLKAVIYQQALRSEFEVDFNAKAISDIRKEMASLENPVQKSILHSALGELYWNYYRQNRFQIADRSQVNVDEESLSTWDIKTILQHARKHYLLSLEGKEKTSAKSLKSLNSILNDHKNTIELHPTVFDFVAYRALEFIQSSDYLLTEANLEIVYSDQKYFAPVENYLKINFPEDKSSVQALRIYQMLLKTHHDNPSALAEANLKRLEHIKSKATFFNKEELYIGALQQFASEIKGSPEWSLAQYYIAQHTFNKRFSEADATLEDKENFAGKALQLCNEAIRAFPESYGATLAEKLKNSILDKSLSITAENAVLPGKPFPVQISYKNFGHLSVNVYRINFDGPWNRQRMDRREKLDFLLKQDPVQHFSKKLTAENRHITTSTEIAMPELEPGYYVVLMSSAEDFVPINEASAFAEFWVTNISFLSWEHGDDKLELTLLNRDDGKEIKRAELRPVTRKYDYKNRKYEYTTEGVFESDRDGKVMLKDKDISSGSFYLDIRDDGDRYVSSSNFYLRDSKRRDKTDTKIYLFTDRVLYRPGQTVQFKGLVLSKNKEGSELVNGYKTEVELRDVNNKVVSEESFSSNEFGSFS
ncbi:MAG TPA: MG2 domain-containing protein, partial [Bacteroidales bacterium]|nr:MG2 domain-containing protein [Bacteroidales bacterium]